MVMFMVVTPGDLGDRRFSIPDRLGHLFRYAGRAWRGSLAGRVAISTAARDAERRGVVPVSPRTALRFLASSQTAPN
jgi:hypothetical protein